ncbi:hypothetical protein AB1Y20_021512 [Prymnesium parvum]|uniref:Sulfotransferase n=1 Tax=Prymnesium parvum TaxID=97485 RepID=A0AB34JKB8_PRYPA
MACNLSQRYHHVHTSSYSLPPTPPIRHALWSACAARPSATPPPPPLPSGPPSAFFIFKVARSGSTFLFETLHRAMPQTQIAFEPYGRRVCAAHAEPRAQEACLSRLLTRRCDVSPLALAASPPADFCEPCRRCTAAQAASAGLVLNARFVPALRLAPLLRAAARPSRVVNLRRTNLVRLAVSKYDHSGLAPQCGEQCVRRNGSARVVLDAGAFVSALSSFAIDDQEVGSASAYGAPPHVPKLLVLYEDLASGDERLVLARLLRFLGVSAPRAAGGDAADGSAPKKIHSNKLRGACRSLKAGACKWVGDVKYCSLYLDLERDN